MHTRPQHRGLLLFAPRRECAAFQKEGDELLEVIDIGIGETALPGADGAHAHPQQPGQR